MQKLLYGIGGLFLLLLAVGFALPAQTRFVVSTNIQAHPATVFALANDLRRSQLWSPLTDTDPEAQIDFAGPVRGVGATVSWNGAIAGSGVQTITASHPYERIEMRLNPGESGDTHAWFDFEDSAGSTTVHWGFAHDYGLNVVGRYFGLLVTGVIRRDYERGLENLKELAESMPSTDFSELDLTELPVAAISIALKPARSTPDPAAMSAALNDAYFDVLRFMDRNSLVRSGPPISILRSNTGATVHFEAGIPVAGVFAETPTTEAAVRIGTGYSGMALKVRHIGSYRTLTETHRKIAAYLTVLGIERNGDPWETYVSDPADVDEAELITDIFYPIKAL